MGSSFTPQIRLQQLQAPAPHPAACNRGRSAVEVSQVTVLPVRRMVASSLPLCVSRARIISPERCQELIDTALSPSDRETLQKMRSASQPCTVAATLQAPAVAPALHAPAIAPAPPLTTPPPALAWLGLRPSPENPDTPAVGVTWAGGVHERWNGSLASQHPLNQRWRDLQQQVLQLNNAKAAARAAADVVFQLMLRVVSLLPENPG